MVCDRTETAILLPKIKKKKQQQQQQKRKQSWDVVEHLSTMCKGLSLIPRTAKEKKLNNHLCPFPCLSRQHCVSYQLPVFP
jgi:hypothetical protein